jgi:hypothetical protein
MISFHLSMWMLQFLTTELISKPQHKFSNVSARGRSLADHTHLHQAAVSTGRVVLLAHQI